MSTLCPCCAPTKNSHLTAGKQTRQPRQRLFRRQAAAGRLGDSLWSVLRAATTTCEERETSSVGPVHAFRTLRWPAAAFWVGHSCFIAQNRAAAGMPDVQATSCLPKLPTGHTLHLLDNPATGSARQRCRSSRDWQPLRQICLHEGPSRASSPAGPQVESSTSSVGS